MESMILSLMIFIPLIGMGVILCLPRDNHNLIRWTAAATTMVPLILCVFLFMNFDRANPAVQFVLKKEWIGAFKIHYYVGAANR